MTKGVTPLPSNDYIRVGHNFEKFVLYILINQKLDDRITRHATANSDCDYRRDGIWF